MDAISMRYSAWMEGKTH